MDSELELLSKIMGDFEIPKKEKLLKELEVLTEERKEINTKINFAKSWLFHIEANEIADIMENNMTMFQDIKVSTLDRIINKIRRM